jgi:hypothetical protein
MYSFYILFTNKSLKLHISDLWIKCGGEKWIVSRPTHHGASIPQPCALSKPTCARDNTVTRIHGIRGL